VVTSVTDAERYSRDLDLILQELEADKTLQEQDIQKQREATWKKLGWYWTDRWKSRNWTPEKMERLKQRFLDILFFDDDQE